MFPPRFALTPNTVKALMSVEADRQLVASLPITAPMLDSLRRTARLLSTHFSTQIEGNRLSPAQVEQVIEGEGKFPGRERDESEVRNYYAALQHVEALGRSKDRLTEREIQMIHGLVMSGKKKATPYRAGQNVIRDARTGAIVYLPPEAKDVPRLMRELVLWLNESLVRQELPAPVVAAVAHYQFATIHPYFDGNGRTARLLTTLLLHQSGYGLNGIYSLEEYYAANLNGYYAALALGTSHNYFGRADADLSPFVDYFCAGMADAFAKVRARAEYESRRGAADQSLKFRRLSPQQRSALGLFLRVRVIRSQDIAQFFKLKPRSASSLCRQWVDDGFFTIENPSTKGRSYRLADAYESIVIAQQESKPVRRKRPRLRRPHH